MEVRNRAADYSDTDDQMLIEQLIQRVLSKRGIVAHPDEVLVTVGGQQALYLAMRLLLSPGETIGVEDPGYPDEINMAGMEGIGVRRLPIDRGGLILSDALGDCKCLFVTPSHQFPTTVTMPLHRKLALLEITRKNGQFVIEDDYESDISFNLTPPQALKGLDGWGNVVYTGSLSKSLLPGLRIGYLVADRDFIREARALRHHLIRHPPVNNQRSVALFLQRGYFDRFVAKITPIYRQRCGVMHEALERHFPGAAERPDYGGAIIWVRLPEDPDYKDFIANGGGISSYLLDERAYRANLEAFYRRKGIDPRTVMGLGRRGWHAIERIADAFEMSTRLGAFKQARKRGLDPRAAAYQGREVSVDFGMRGDSRAIGAAYDTIIFLKAAVNSVDRLYRGIAHDPQRAAIAYKTALIALALYALNRDNPLYDELEDWDRDTHFHFFIPKPEWWDFDGEPETPEEASRLFWHFRLPKPWEIGAIASIAERALEAIVDGQDRDTATAILNIVTNLWRFEYAPAIVEPLYEWARNEDRFTGRPIVGRGLESLEPFAQSRVYTSETVKALGEATRKLPPWAQISPARFEHLLRGYLNTWAMYGLTLSDAVFFDDKPDLRTDQLPVIRSFYRQKPARGTRYMTEFYEMLDAATQARRTIYAMARRHRPDDVQRLLQRRQVRISDQLNAGHKRLRAFRRANDAIMAAKSVEELHKFARRLAKEFKDPAILTEAVKVWRDKGALKLLLRDARIVRRAREMEAGRGDAGSPRPSRCDPR